VEPYSIEEGGYVLIDKDLEWTSFDVVKKLRNLVRIKKIGHAGTLDPLATGLLIVCYGKYTKKIEGIQAQKKTYTGNFVLGKTTESYDLEQPVVEVADTAHLKQETIAKAANRFCGTIEQIPPAHSAIRVKGKRAYEHARNGEEVKLKARKIVIDKFEVDATHLPEVAFELVCSKGTYVRSLARDLGETLEVGAYLGSLRRTQIGEYNVNNAVRIADIKSRDEFFQLAKQF
jgi:tRNA pseudouridine55 synthase